MDHLALESDLQALLVPPGCALVSICIIFPQFFRALGSRIDNPQDQNEDRQPWFSISYLRSDICEGSIAISTWKFLRLAGCFMLAGMSIAEFVVDHGQTTVDTGGLVLNGWKFSPIFSHPAFESENSSSEWVELALCAFYVGTFLSLKLFILTEL